MGTVVVEVLGWAGGVMVGWEAGVAWVGRERVVGRVEVTGKATTLSLSYSWCCSCV